MEINSDWLFDLFISKGITHLYHANSVPTSISFLRAGALLGRGVVENRGLFQTPQYSDEVDKEVGVFYDVFLDSVDIHARARRRNKYGPVLFGFSVEKLKAMKLPPIWVTRSNPADWRTTPFESRWFTSQENLSQEFTKGTFEQMIVFRHQGGILPLDALEQILIDDPKIPPVGENLDLYSVAFGGVWSATEGNLRHVNLAKRVCAPECKCASEYAALNDYQAFVHYAKL